MTFQEVKKTKENMKKEKENMYISLYLPKYLPFPVLFIASTESKLPSGVIPLPPEKFPLVLL